MNMTQIASFAVVDWGTSSFRLWVMARDGSVLGERRSDQGLSAGERDGFGAILEEHLTALGASDDLPVAICGMAGSRQGWAEARYIETPTALSGVFDKAISIEGTRRDIRILPGIAQNDPLRPDVMRGEETQLLGVLAQGVSDAVICMPGTHSKWVELQGGRLASFSTYMTGEMFNLIAQGSILRHAISPEGVNVEADEAFLAGAEQGARQPENLTNFLFQIRAGQLLHGTSPEDARARLSGLLIGQEIGAALQSPAYEVQTKKEPVVLIASGGLGKLYAATFSHLEVAIRVVEADDAVRYGLHRAASHFWPTEKKE